MPHSSRASPVKPLGECSGNSVMSSHSPRRSARNVAPLTREAKSLHQFPESTNVPKVEPSPERRSRSSKYLKSFLERDKTKTRNEITPQEKIQGHRRSKSSNTSYTVFPKPTASDHRNIQKDDSSDKENSGPPPIWAQFASDGPLQPSVGVKIPLNDECDIEKEALRYTPRDYSPSKQKTYAPNEQPTLSRKTQTRPRPKSDCLTGSASQSSFIETLSALRHPRKSQEYKAHPQHSRRNSLLEEDHKQIEVKGDSFMPSELTVNKRGSRVMAAVAAFNTKSKQQQPMTTKEPEIKPWDPKHIDQAFESMLVSPVHTQRDASANGAGCS